MHGRRRGGLGLVRTGSRRPVVTPCHAGHHMTPGGAGHGVGGTQTSAREYPAELLSEPAQTGDRVLAEVDAEEPPAV